MAASDWDHGDFGTSSLSHNCSFAVLSSFPFARFKFVDPKLLRVTFCSAKTGKASPQSPGKFPQIISWGKKREQTVGQIQATK